MSREYHPQFEPKQIGRRDAIVGLAAILLAQHPAFVTRQKRHTWHYLGKEYSFSVPPTTAYFPSKFRHRKGRENSLLNRPLHFYISELDDTMMLDAICLDI